MINSLIPTHCLNGWLRIIILQCSHINNTDKPQNTPCDKMLHPGSDGDRSHVTHQRQTPFHPIEPSRRLFLLPPSIHTGSQLSGWICDGREAFMITWLEFYCALWKHGWHIVFTSVMFVSIGVRHGYLWLKQMFAMGLIQ